MKGKIEALIGKIISDLRKCESVIVAYSGGVDSSVVAALAYKALGGKALAVTVDSPLLPYGELANAKHVARHIGIKHLIVKFDELKLPGFSRNPSNRCYICKKARFQLLREIAEQKGFKTITDGTNLDDSKEYRPGITALKEENIYSPLLENRVDKATSRKIASILGLPVANKPSNTCLATRLPYGQEITLEKLNRINLAEAYIKRKLKIEVVRVRDHDGLARIELEKGFLKENLKNYDYKAWLSITKKFKKLGFKYVTLDVESYRSGVFDKALGLKF